MIKRERHGEGKKSADESGEKRPLEKRHSRQKDLLEMMKWRYEMEVLVGSYGWNTGHI